MAALVLRRPSWFAIDDYALIEMRVRDVASSHPPLVGLGGRIEHDGVPGSHPGPLAFYLLYLPYRLFGGSSWALQAATLVSGLAAVSLTVWIARRRAGTTGVLVAATGVAVLLVAYGPERWALPWNPYLPLLWWPVVLVAAWSVLCRDWPMLPVLVVAASFCAQTHVSYVGLVAGLGAVVVASLAWSAWSARSTRRDGGPDGDEGPPSTERPGRWAAVAAALLLVLWLPPIIDQVGEDPGNMSILVGQFSDDDIPAAGWRTAAEVMLARLDPVDLVSGDGETTAGSALGLAFLAAWALAAGAAVARRDRLPSDLVRLHLVAGVAAALGVVSLSRVQGPMFPYLTLWSWGTAVVMAAATVWTAVALWTRAPPREAGRRRPVVAAVAGVAAVAILVVATFAASDAEPPLPERTARDRALIPTALDALEAGTVPGFDDDDRYLVAAQDPSSGSLSSLTLLNEMDKRGFDARIAVGAAHAAGSHRVREQADATAVVTLATGPAVDDLRADPGAVELAHVDLSPADADEAARLRARLVDLLEEAGVDDAAEQVDRNLFALSFGGELPPGAEAIAGRLLDLGAAAAVFVEPGPAA